MTCKQEKAGKILRRESTHKMSLDSFKNINQIDSYSSDQKLSQNTFSSNNITHNGGSCSSSNNVPSERIQKSRKQLDEIQSPLGNIFKRLSQQSQKQLPLKLNKIQSASESSSSRSLPKLEKTKSSQNTLKNEIILNLCKTKQYIKQFNLGSQENNMILSSVTVFHSKIIKSKGNNNQPNNIHQSQASIHQSQANIRILRNSLSQNQINVGNTPNTNCLQNILTLPKESNQIQLNSSNNINNNGNSTQYNQVNLLDNSPLKTDICNSFQTAIANSIYGSSNFTNSPFTQPQSFHFSISENANLMNNNNSSHINTNINPQEDMSTLNLNGHQSQKDLHANVNSNVQSENQKSRNDKKSFTNISGTTFGQAASEYRNQQTNLELTCNFPTSQNSASCNANQHHDQTILNASQNIGGWGTNSTYSFKNICVSSQSQDKVEDKFMEVEISLFGAVIEGEEMTVVMIKDVTHRKYIELLKLANKQKQQVVSYLSHELRNPLSCIINMLDTVEYDLQDIKGSRQQEIDYSKIEELENNVSTALQNSKYILNLSNDYLDMARIKAKQFKLNIQPFNLQQLLRECIKLFQIQAMKVNTEIILKNKVLKNRFIYDQETSKNIVYSDCERVKQVIINLISNALKFTHNGQIFIKSEYISYFQLQISIKDTGIGIEQNKVKQLFKAFGKIDDEENQHLNRQGVGLGLLISNMLSIQLSKYSEEYRNETKKSPEGLIVQSEKGIGSTFILTLTDHNLQNKNKIKLNKHEIQQITETQESSAQLSQSQSQKVKTQLENKDKQQINQSCLFPILEPVQSLHSFKTLNNQEIIFKPSRTVVKSETDQEDLDNSQNIANSENKNQMSNSENLSISFQTHHLLNIKTHNAFPLSNQIKELPPLANTVKLGLQIKNKFQISQKEGNDLILVTGKSDNLNFFHNNMDKLTATKKLIHIPHEIKKGGLEFTKRSSAVLGLSFTGNEEVLIVDDNIFCCEALKNIIEKRFGLRCQICFSAMKAVEMVKQRYSFIHPNQKKHQMSFLSNMEISEKLKDSPPKNQKKKPINLFSSLQISNKDESDEISKVESSNNLDLRLFKFIFMDINMPGLNGFQGLYLIKSFLSSISSNFDKECRIIGCSGVDENYVENQHQLNSNPLTQFDGFLFKPVLKEKLQEFFSCYGINLKN